MLCGHLCYLPSPVVKCQTRLWVQPSVIYSPFSSFTFSSSRLKSSECEGKYHLFLHSAISPQSASGPDALVDTRTFSLNHPWPGRCRLCLRPCLRSGFYRKYDPVCDWSIHGALRLLANQRFVVKSGSAKEILCFCSVLLFLLALVRPGFVVVVVVVVVVLIMFNLSSPINLKYLGFVLWKQKYKCAYKVQISHPGLKRYIKAASHVNGIFHHRRRHP